MLSSRAIQNIPDMLGLALMVEKLDANKIYKIAESGNTGAHNQRIFVSIFSFSLQKRFQPNDSLIYSLWQPFQNCFMEQKGIKTIMSNWKRHAGKIKVVRKKREGELLE